jgi:hypothetical protein
LQIAPAGVNSRRRGFLPHGNGTTPYYRLYLLDKFTGHIDGVEHLTSADDVGAIALATERPRGVPTELWCESRKICRIDAPPEVPKYGLQGDWLLSSS